jgi:hypothetical protein
LGPPIEPAEQEKPMKTPIRAVTVIVGIVLFGTIFAPAASAGCGVPTEQTGSTGRPQQPAWPSQSAYRPVSFLLVGDHDEDAVIVGLWQVTFVSKNSSGIPDGAVIDAGYATWHSDGTEIMNSGRPPITGNFCMGVWKEVGRSKFRLNHVALSWDPSGANLVGPANIREEVTVDHTGNTYVGTFTIDQFDNAGNTLAHITGRVTGQRITVN